MYRKLKRTWSHNSINYIPRFREVFPELNKIDSEMASNSWKPHTGTIPMKTPNATDKDLTWFE